MLTTAPRFKLGQIVATPGTLDVLEQAQQSPIEFLRRHVAGDWGDVDAEDKALNDQAVLDGTRLLSSYRTCKGQTIWVITEADRSATTFLLPEDY